MTCMLLFLAFSGRYFANATIYDDGLNGLREGVHVLVDADGRVALVSNTAIPVSEGTQVIEKALILPLLSDFYNLVQERGLGSDEDVDMANQARMARYLRRIGMFQLRDPVFPPAGLSPLMVELLDVRACRGYLELEGGPGQGGARMIAPGTEVETIAKMVPERGPVTLWWTRHGGDLPVTWSQHGTWLNELIAYFQQQGRKVGAYIQDATAEDLGGLSAFPFDFYEGMPGETVDINDWPEITWVPLAALNDRRYCARNVSENLERLKGMGLYEDLHLERALAAVEGVRARIRPRCQVWRERRDEVLEPLRQWLQKGGRVALGSGGGHMFSFSGSIGEELRLLEDLGASQPDLLAAAFVHTPDLLGVAPVFLKPGRPANFIAYAGAGHWVEQLGRRVSWQYLDGKDGNQMQALPLLK